MGTPTIDLSAGIVPAQPPPPKPGGIDLSAGLVKPTTPATPPPPANPVPASVPHISANPNKEGVYRMIDKSGNITGIPYSNVPSAMDLGYDFDWSGKHGAGGEGQRYGDDWQADPNRQQDPAEQYGRAFVGSLRSHFGGAMQLLGKLQAHMASPDEVINFKKEHPTATTEQALSAIEGTDLDSQIVGPYKSQHRRDEAAELQKTADWFKSNNQQQGVAGWLGAASENLGELLGPGELMKLGEGPVAAGDVVTAADKMQAGAKVANLLKNHPVINRLVGLGLRALKTGAESGATAGAQTFVDTGGDTDQTAEATALGAAGGTALHVAGEGVSMATRALLAKLARPATTADAVGDAARGVLADRLAATNATRTLPTNALPQSTGEFQFHIGGPPTAESTIGLRAGSPIEDADEGASLLVDARKKQIGTRVLPGKGPTNGATAHNANLADYGINDTTGAPPPIPDGSDPNARGSYRTPKFQYLDTPRPGTLQPRVETNTGGGTLTTTDPKLAAAHLSSLKDAIEDPAFAELPPQQQAAIRAAHDDMRQQIVDYYKHQKIAAPAATNVDTGKPANTISPLPETGADSRESLADMKEEIASPVFAARSPEVQQSFRNYHDFLQDWSDRYEAQNAAGQNTLPAKPARTPYAPNFQPVQAKGLLDQTGNFADAADHLHNTAVEVYDHANNVTGGQWQALDKHIGDLQDKLSSEPFPAGRAALRQQIAEAQRAMSDILEDPRNGFDQTDITQAKANFRAKYVLQDAHQAVKPLYGVEEHTGLTTGQYRGFNGNMVGQRWQEFLKANPDARQIVGSDRVDTLQRLFDANGTMAARKRFGNAIASVGTALLGYHAGGIEGGAAAEAAYQGIRYALRGMVASPAAAKRLLFAIDSGARPEQYAPDLARLIQRTVPAAAGGTVRTLNGDQEGRQ